MNVEFSETERHSCLSDAGRKRLLSVRGEPLFFAAWEKALFIHFEIAPEILEHELPFELDVRDGKAFVSLVAFTMRNMRPRFGGKISALLFKPIATHSFLNVRTYVKNNGEPGICFLTEWLSSWLSVQFGPIAYGLPYRYARIDYRHGHKEKKLSGRVESRRTGRFIYEAKLSGNSFAPCEAGSLDEFLLERYTAFNWRGAKRFFRIWHPPWPQVKADVSIRENTLLAKAFPWFPNAKPVGANYSCGFEEVWMGRAQFCR